MDQNLPFTPTLNPITPSSSATFTPVSKLFKSSWDRVQNHLLKLFLLTVILFAAGIVFLILAAIIMAVAGFFSPGATGSNSITLVGIILFPAAVVAIIAGMLALNIATILVLAETQPALSLMGLYKLSVKKIVPMIVVSLISGFIVLGGLVVFVVPGILFSILLSMSVYYLVLDNVSPIEAMRKSVFAVSKNFGVVFIRMCALIGFSFVVGIILNIFSSQSNSASLLVSLISLVFNLLYGWFSMAFMMLMFQEVKKAAGDGRGKLLWLVIVAAIGWLIIFSGGYLVFRAAANNPALNTQTPLQFDNTLLDLDILEDEIATPVASLRPASASASVRPTATPRPSATPRASAATSSANR